MTDLEKTEQTIPPPPYALSEIELVNCFVTFDPDTVRPYVPAALELTERVSGGVRVYSVRAGHGIAPFTAAVVFVDVANNEAADGTSAMYAVKGCFSRTAIAAFRRYHSSRDVEGEAQITHQEDIVVGGSRNQAGDFIRLAVRPAPDPSERVSGVNYYFFGAAEGIRVMPVAFSTKRTAADAVSLDVGEGLLQACPGLKIRDVIRASYSQDAAFTLGQSTPYQLEGAALASEETKVGVLNVLSQLRKGTALVDQHCRILFLNPIARTMIGDGIEDVSGYLRSSRRQDQAKLDTAITEALSATARRSVDVRPIAVARPSGRPPLLIKPLHVGSRRAGSPVETACALLITDPDQQEPIDVTYSLQLLGLTPAEARIASLVGAGLPPVDVADRVGNTERSVRVTLSRVFDKLDISRQSELAVVVGRISDLAT